MTKIGEWFVLFSLVFLTLSSSAAVKVYATVDRNEISQGDVLIYSINVTTDGGQPVFDSQPVLPELKGLELVGSSSSSESRSTFIGGKFTVQQTRSFDYQLSAAQKGKFTIGKAKVSISGKEYETSPIDITVKDYGSGGGQIPPQAGRQRGQVDPLDQVEEMEDMFNQLLQRRFRGGVPGQQAQPPINPNEAFFIQAQADKQKVYAGEQVTASWYLYTRGQIADIDTLKYPDLKGFWKEEIEMATRLNFQQEVINGIPYQKALLVSYALFPIKPGKAIVDAYKAKCTVVVGSSFGFGKAYPFTKSSRPLDIQVLELPAEGRPPEFSGAVGRFQVNATLDPASVPANQPTTLKLKFSGAGNAKLIDLPPLNLPPSIELYSQKGEAKFFKDGTSYKEFEVLLIPREVGTFDIPAVKAAYFDPEKGKYVSIGTPKLTLNVSPGKPGEGTVFPQAGKQEPAKNDWRLPAPMLREAGQPLIALPIRKVGWAIVFACIVIGLSTKSYFVFFKKPKKETLIAALRKRMKVVQAAIDAKDWRKTGVEMTNAIYLILGDITDQGGANLQYEKLMEAASPSLRRELSHPLRELLDRAETLGFAPEAAVASLKDSAELNKLRKDGEKLLAKAIDLGERNDQKDA